MLSLGSKTEFGELIKNILMVYLLDFLYHVLNVLLGLKNMLRQAKY